MSTDMPMSAAYQKTADTLRRCAREKLGPKDPAHDMLQLAANQLENAADTAMELEQITKIIEDKGMGLGTRKARPANAGQWEGDRSAELKRAKLDGFMLGIGSMGLVIAAILLVLA